jgi:hypothetical protein
MHGRFIATTLIASIAVCGLGFSRGAAYASRADKREDLAREAIAAAPGRYLAPNDLAAYGKGMGAMRELHDYGQTSLVDVDPRGLPTEAVRLLTPLEDASQVSFRAWTGPADAQDIGDGGDGYYLVSFDAPIDAVWMEELDRIGAKVVETAPPYTLVVRAEGSQLEALANLRTTTGTAAVRGVRVVPRKARLAPLLAGLRHDGSGLDEVEGLRRSDDGRVVVRAIAYPDRSVEEVVHDVSQYAEPARDKAGYGYADAFVVSGSEIEAILANVPGVAYVEPVFDPTLCGNLAATSQVHAIQPMWDLGWDGSGVKINHNDNGIDLNGVNGVGHFPVGSVTAIAGVMSNTDNTHGTHTAWLLAGRPLGGQPLADNDAPASTFGCGDLISPVTNARGMAPGATINSNNFLFADAPSGYQDGFTTVEGMMKWAQDKGSQISSNSWGRAANTSYSSESRAVDQAVRDADPTEQSQQPLTIVFAAGNNGSTTSSITAPGTAKNAITVGASHNARCGSYPTPFSTYFPLVKSIADFSSRGPAQTRIKPDLVAAGTNVLSVASNDPFASHPWDQPWTGEQYELYSSTSMSTAIVAGASACFFEFYKSTYGRFPSPALAKAALVNGAKDMGGGYEKSASNAFTTGIFAQGWGRLNLKNSIQGPSGGTIHFVDETAKGLTTGQTSTFKVDVTNSLVPLKISLVWTDPEGPAGEMYSSPLVNNLNLVVKAPDGTVYRGNLFSGSYSTPNPNVTHVDRANNVECVFVNFPATGTWTIEVMSANTARNVAGKTGQDFALVYSGGVKPGELLTNAGFDTGSVSPWTATTGTSLTTANEHSGTHCAKMLGFGATFSSSLQQRPAFPITGAGRPLTLTFYLRIASAEASATPNDVLDVKINTAAAPFNTILATFSNTDETEYAGWKKVTLTIPADLAVSGTHLQFQASENASQWTAFYIDSVSVR